MKNLAFEQMEVLCGGAEDTCDKVQSPAVQTIGAVCSIASCFGIAGLLIFGPTALAISIASAVCSY